MNPEPNHDTNLSYKIIGLAMRVHRNLGPGLLESVYRRCLCHELSLANLAFEQEVYLPIRYNGIRHRRRLSGGCHRTGRGSP
jgi:GxxExxY protein